MDNHTRIGKTDVMFYYTLKKWWINIARLVEVRLWPEAFRLARQDVRFANPHSRRKASASNVEVKRNSQAHTNPQRRHPAPFSLVFRTPRKTLTQKDSAKMSDGEVEVEAPQGYPVLPKDVSQEIGATKLFNKWSYEDVEIRDISLT
jgi:hypothetical protein